MIICIRVPAYIILSCFYEEEEEVGQIVSLGDSRIKRVRDRIAFLSMLTVRVVVLEYSQLHKKA